MAEKQVKIVIAADVAAALRGLQQVEQGLGRVGEQGNQAGASSGGFMDKLQTGLSIVGVQAGFDGIVAGFKSVVSSGMEYEQNMNMLQAVSGATGAQMSQVSTLAKSLGNDLTLPGASAQSATAAMLELSKGGLTLDESMSAVRGTLVLAAAAQIDGAAAAEIQSAALNTFGLAASDADRVANVLANTANASAGEITDFAQGLAQAGTIANSFGWSIEETSTYLGLMANAGIKGSDAGTSLKTTLTAMLNPTKQQSAALAELGITTQDANGNMISASALTDQLAAAKGRMSQADFTAAAATAFGSDAVRTALVAADAGAAGYDSMATAISKAGGAQEVAAANAKGLTGALDTFANSASTAGLALYENFSPALQDIVGFATGAVGALADFGGWFSDLPGPVQAAAIALTGVIVLGGPLRSMSAGVAAQVRLVGGAFTSTGAAAATSAGGFAAWIVSVRTATGAAATFGAVAKGAMAFLGSGIGLAILGVTTALSIFAATSDDAAAATTDLAGAVDENTGAMNSNAQAVIARAAAESGAAAAYKAAGGDVKDYTAALSGNVSAQDKVRQVLSDAADAAADAGTAYQAAGVGADGMVIASDTVTTVMGEQSGAFNNAQAAMGLFEADLAKVTAAQDTGALAAEGGAAAVDTQAQVTAEAVDPIKALKDATDNLTSASDFASAAVSFMAASIDAAAGGTIPLEVAQNAAAAAIRGIGAATRDTAQAMADQDAAAVKVGEAVAKFGGDSAEAAEAQRKYEDAVAGVTDATDDQLTTNIDARDKALAYASALYAQQLAAGDLEGATQSATQALDEAKAAFIAAQPQADILSGKAQITADKLFGIPKDTVARIAETGANATQEAARAVTSAIGDIPKNPLTVINAKDNATVVIQDIAGKLAALNGYSAWTTVGTRYVTEGSPTTKISTPGTGGLEDGGVVHAATGRLVTGRGTSAVMDGSGAGLTWAEAATNKEYYLSMKAGMEQRNRGLASQAVSDLGGQAVWGRPDVRAGSFSPPPAQRVIVELTGEGITAEMARTAIVTVNGALVEVAQGINRGRGQS